MTPLWAIRLPMEKAVGSACLREVAGVEVCEREEAVWLRGYADNESLDLRLRAIAGADRFRVLPDGQLLSPGAFVPHGWLPEGPWLELKNWITLTLDPPAFAGRLDNRTFVKLVRAAAEETPSVIQTTMDSWHDFGTAASQVRLDKWYFAVSEDGRVTIRGIPLPSIAGLRYFEKQGIAVPLGWTWSPAVDAGTLRELFDLHPNDLVLLQPDGTCQKIRADNFVGAGRSAIRVTAEDFRHG